MSCQKSRVFIDGHAHSTLDPPLDLLRKYRIRSAADMYFFACAKEEREEGRLLAIVTIVHDRHTVNSREPRPAAQGLGVY